MNKRNKKKFNKTVKFLSEKEHEFYRDYLSGKNWNPLRVMMFLEKLELLPEYKRGVFLNLQNYND